MYIVPMENVDIPARYVGLPEGTCFFKEKNRGNLRDDEC